MKLFTISLPEEAAAFYEAVAAASDHTPEQVLCDTLYKLAGELALEALQNRPAV